MGLPKPYVVLARKYRPATFDNLIGQDAMVTVYAGAHHSFDNIGRSLLYLPNVDSGANCTFQIASILGPFPPPSEAAKCVRKGATIAWSPEATEQARRNVRAQLAELLR